MNPFNKLNTCIWKKSMGLSGHYFMKNSPPHIQHQRLAR